MFETVGVLTSTSPGRGAAQWALTLTFTLSLLSYGPLMESDDDELREIVSTNVLVGVRGGGREHTR